MKFDETDDSVQLRFRFKKSKWKALSTDVIIKQYENDINTFANSFAYLDICLKKL